MVREPAGVRGNHERDQHRRAAVDGPGDEPHRDRGGRPAHLQGVDAQGHRAAPQAKVCPAIDLERRGGGHGFIRDADFRTPYIRWESGVERPRLAVCALNPHNGENGAFGRQEIDHIRPAVEAAREKGIDVQGPFPCDTIFLKRAHFDGIVTMYHDQGQIAMKLLSFDGGVTVQGGLPVPVATPAHGTAFDIVGKNIASVTSTQNAFDIAVTMAERRISKEEEESRGQGTAAAPLKTDPLPRATTVEVASCC